MLIPIEYNNEVYKEITQKMVPGIDIGRYFVSNCGTIYDKLRNCQVHQNYYSQDGYLGVSLHTINGFYRVLSHRLVAKAFIDGDWSLQVNHCDGKKNNNFDTNLEFVSARENLMHALETGLNHRCEDKPNSTFTNEQVEQICLYLENGYSYSEIIDKMNLENITIIRHRLADIKRGRTYKSISSKYNIPDRKIIDRQLSKEQADIVCKILYENPNISNSELFNAASIDVSSKEKYEKARHCIESIKRGKAYNDIKI